ncbi:AraC family transcriptional regulator [Undibacterium arcticum]
MSLSPIYHPNDAPPCDILFVCGGTNVREAVSDDVISLLRTYAANGTPMGALCTGTFALAKAGLLNGYRCAIHWEKPGGNPGRVSKKILFSQELFVIDRNMFTCSGGTAPLDLMLNLIRLKGGKKSGGRCFRTI